jgi:hypothetical protein
MIEMALSKLQQRDRAAWFSGLRSKVKTQKVMSVTLKAGSPSLAEIQGQMGRDVACKIDGDVLTLAVIQKPAVILEAEGLTKGE